MMRLRGLNRHHRSSSAGYGFAKVWLWVGGLIAFLLLVNAVRDFFVVSEVRAVQDVHNQLTQIVSVVDQQLRQDGLTDDLLRSSVAGPLQQHESLTLRDSEGKILSHYGSEELANPFSPEEQRDAFTHRRSLFRTVNSGPNRLVVEVFGMHPPHGGRGDTKPPSLQDSGRGRTERAPLTLEIALPLSSADPAALQPLKRNLVISTAAGVSFLVTVFLTALGLRSYVKGRTLEEQVELARQVQARLLPARDSAITSKRSAVVYEPAEEVGGDFYDLWPREHSGLAAVIGDVSGKGLPAALLMGVIHGAIRTSNWQGSGLDQCASTSELNRLLCEGASQNRYASMFWCVLDETAGELRYTNAGHCPPFLLRAGVNGPTCVRLTEGGTVLGLIPDAAYSSATEIVHPGDLLVMYSDGLTEATSEAGEEYGDSRVERFLLSHFSSDIDLLARSLVASWRQFSPDVVSHDDLTVVVIRL